MPSTPGRIVNSYESLDASSQERKAYNCLFDVATGELHPDPEELLEVPVGRHVVIAERARTAMTGAATQRLSGAHNE
jgi:hypothetical protein